MTEQLECLAADCSTLWPVGSVTKCPVAETSPGTRHNEVCMGCKGQCVARNSCNAQLLAIRWCKSVDGLIDY